MIVICWEQLPIYAARSLGKFVEVCDEDVVILRVPMSRFPIKGAAEMTKTKVIDVKYNDTRSLVDIVGCIPDVFVCGGWGEKSFRRWLREVKDNGGKTIVCTDEPYRGRGWTELLRKLRFKICLANLIDYVFVAGKGGILKFVDYYGVAKDRVIIGLYAGDPTLFFDGLPLLKRDKRFIFVGHYDSNKNVIPMCKAFAMACLELQQQASGWELDVYGGGPIEKELQQVAVNINEQLSKIKVDISPVVNIHGYVNADQLGPMYREARCFVLGSHAEQWGVVVHEAVMSGCMLLLSNHVGSRFDFSSSENAVEFNPDSIEDFASGFRIMMLRTEDEMLIAQQKSLELGRQFSPQLFAKNLMQMVNSLRK